MKIIRHFNRLIAVLCLALAGLDLQAQTFSVSTTGSTTNNNGTGTVVFNFRNNNSYPIEIKEVHGVTSSTAANVATALYYKTTPTSSAPGAIDLANGWNLVASGTITGLGNSTTTITQPFLTNLSFVVPANTTWSLAVFATSQRYFTHPGGVTSDSSNGVFIIQGTNNSYAGGTPPAAPTNHPRAWIGRIEWRPMVPCSIPYPGQAIANRNIACSGSPFTLQLTNDSVRLGLTYQWISSSTGLPGSYVLDPADSLRTLPKSQTSSTFYRCIVTCGSLTDTSTAVFVNTPTNPLAGSYTINPSLPASSSNFSAIADFADALSCVGVSGPVTATVAPNSTFVGQVNFGAISGASDTNRIVINGQGSIITQAPSPMVTFNNTAYVTLDSLKVMGGANFGGFGIHLTNNTRFVTIRACTVEVSTTATGTGVAGIVASGSQTSATQAGNNANNVTLINNTILGGYYSIIFIGNASYQNCYGNRIERNVCRDFYLYGIYFNNADSAVVLGNDINRITRTTISTFYGFYMATSRNMKVIGNQIHDAGSGSYACYPIYIVTASVNAPGAESDFVNNLIYNNQTTSTYYGIYGLTGTYTGLRFLHNTVHHTIPATATGAVRSIFLNGTLSSLVIRNNNFTLSGGGTGAKFSIYITNASASILSNNNNFFNASTGGTYNLGYYSAANRSNLAAWQTATSQDASSVLIDPLYSLAQAWNYTPTNPALNNLGAFAGVSSDILGSARSVATPDIGAFEFLNSVAVCSGSFSPGAATSSTSIACANQSFSLSLSGDTLRSGMRYQWIVSTGSSSGPFTILPADTFRLVTKTQAQNSWYRCIVTCGSTSDTSIAVAVQTPSSAMTGAYTVNPALPASGTNFQTLNEVFNQLTCAGVSGPVTISIAPGAGVVGNQLSLGTIPGASASNPVIIQGNGASIQGNNSPLVSFNGTQYVTLDSLKILGDSNFAGFGVHIGGNSRFLTIQKCSVVVNQTATGTANAGIVCSGSTTGATTAGNNGSYITLEKNTILGGYYSITFIGNSTYADNKGNRVLNNTCSNFYLYGIYFSNADSAQIVGNDINRETRAGISTFYGIYMATARQMDIRSNRIHDAGSGSYACYPIYLTTASVNNTGEETVIANNLIYNNQTTSTYYGIYGLTGTYSGIRFWHNTIHHAIPIAATGAVRNVFLNGTLSNIDFRNNILSLSGGGTGAKHALYITNPSATFTANGNVYFNSSTSGTYTMGFWGQAALTLANWKTLTSMDSASLDVDPAFTSILANNFVPASTNIDNIGLPVSLAEDINGNARSSTTPDPGAFEFTGVGADIKLSSATLIRQNQCYNTNDSIKITLSNLIGSTVDFGVNNLTIQARINGPVNTVDSLVLISDTLGAGLSKDFYLGTANFSLPGTYSLDVWISSSPVNSITANDTLLQTDQLVIHPILSVSPKTALVNSPTDTVIIRAESSIFPSGPFFFTEVCHFKTTVGAPTGGWPSYLVADDYVEITGVPNSDLGGITLEQWSTTALLSSYTFPTGTRLSPNGTAIIAVGQLNASVPSPSNFYYHGGYTGTFGSTGAAGRILRNAQGLIVDAVVYGSFVFPAAAGVTASDWSGATAASSSSGNRLNGADSNSAVNWINSGTQPQDPNVRNSNVPLPQPVSAPGFSWTYMSALYDTMIVSKVGPFTTPGVYAYVAEYTNGCGVFRDTVFVTASSTVPVKWQSFEGYRSGDDAELIWTTASETNNKFYTVERSLNGVDFYSIAELAGKGTTSRTSTYTFTDRNVFADQALASVAYRIRQTDFDGKSELSKTIWIATEELRTEPRFMPNPASDKLIVDWNGMQQQEINVELVDLSGRLVQSSVLSPGAEPTIQLTAPNGVYILKLRAKDQVHTRKLIIQN
ncbi:hypothetical protein MASR2M44_07200 [Bacteroidota bacterium]